MSTLRPTDNRARLVTAVAEARIAPPRVHLATLPVHREGRYTPLPGAGGVNLGVHVGDLVFGRLADHLMVGAAIEAWDTPPSDPGSLHMLACIGNRVRDASGAAIGVIAGKRGGLAPGHMPPNLLSVECEDPVAHSLFPGQRLLVETMGRGLALADFPQVVLANLAPPILDALPLRRNSEMLEVDVTVRVPARVAGAGLGQDSWVGDLEICDDDLSRDLRFGDLVAFDDIDGSTLRFYRPGHVTVGMIAHGPSPLPGHGAGATILMSGPETVLRAFVRREGTVCGELRRMASLK